MKKIVFFSILVAISSCTMDDNRTNNFGISDTCEKLDGKEYYNCLNERPYYEVYYKFPENKETISLIKLIANPEKFNNRSIETGGYFLYIGHKEGILCLNINDIDEISWNCVRLMFKEEPEEYLEKSYVHVSGIYRDKRKYSPYAGLIEVDYIDSPPRRWTKEPSEKYTKDPRSIYKFPVFKQLFR